MPLDEVKHAGCMDLPVILQYARNRDLSFAESIDIIVSKNSFMATIADETKFERAHTAPKWKAHLKNLETSHILTSLAELKLSFASIKNHSKYFAVPKSDGLLARAILNYKQASKAFLTPKPVNLPLIESVLKSVAEGGRFWCTADWRHYFHQFPLGTFTAPYFSVTCGSDTRIWRTMPMGWAWSPRIAQCASWTMVIEALCRAKLWTVDEATKRSPNPPSYIKTKSLFLVIWYDNLLACFENERDRDKFDTAIHDVCEIVRCDWKEFHRWNLNTIGPNTKKQPTYLGVTFATRPVKADRSGTREREVIWKHDPTRLKRWKDVQTVDLESWTPRHFARAVGVILWDVTVNVDHFYKESATIDILRKAGAEARSVGWDVVTKLTWTANEINLLNARVTTIVENNQWRIFHRTETTHTIHAASDASGNIGFGGIRWDPSGGNVETIVSGTWKENCPELAEAHIFLKEYLAAALTIEKITRLSQKARILLAVDNTALVHSLRARYSSNAHANEFIKRIVGALETSNCDLEIVAVASADNAADAASRNEPFSEKVFSRCHGQIVNHEIGRGLSGCQMNAAPTVCGSRRHEEPLTDDMLSCRISELLFGQE